MNNKAGLANKDQKYTLYFWLLLLLGIFLRCLLFGVVPGGINMDEAFAGYEAYSLLNYGTDSAGYHFPVYLVTWGSGMNALESYLMMPFIALFGLNSVTVRLPQLIVGILSLPVIYKLVSRLYNPKTGIIAMGLLTVCPWHIMMNRWGLESNLAPGMILFATYFLVKAFDNRFYLILSAFFYGLSLYAYATIWTIVPFILLFELAYLFYTRKIRFDISFIISAAVMLILALPLILFVMVNMGWINEIRTSFFSIPKMPVFRSNEVSLSNLGENLRYSLYVIFAQYDGLVHNGIAGFGTIGFITFIFSVFGCLVMFRNIRSSVKKDRRLFCADVITAVNLILPLFLGLTIQVNINRINVIFIPLIIAASLRFSEIDGKKMSYVFIGLYAALTIAFGVVYFTSYKDKVAESFGTGLKEALAEADSREGTVYLSYDIYHSQVLFYEKVPVNEYLDTVVYEEYPAVWLYPVTFSRYSFFVNLDDPDPSGTYILNNVVDASPLEAKGYKITRYGIYNVAYKN